MVNGARHGILFKGGLYLEQTASDSQAIPGQGVQARIDGTGVRIGDQRMFGERRTATPVAIPEEVRSLENLGQTVVVVSLFVF
jgi:cation transport ATPase